MRVCVHFVVCVGVVCVCSFFFVCMRVCSFCVRVCSFLCAQFVFALHAWCCCVIAVLLCVCVHFFVCVRVCVVCAFVFCVHVCVIVFDVIMFG